MKGGGHIVELPFLALFNARASLPANIHPILRPHPQTPPLPPPAAVAVTCAASSCAALTRPDARTSTTRCTQGRGLQEWSYNCCVQQLCLSPSPSSRPYTRHPFFREGFTL